MILIFTLTLAGHAMAETVFDDFSNEAGARWDYVADRVMGGVSEGRAEIIGTEANNRLRLTGTVSTDNNGGFLQVRQRFSDPRPENSIGVKLRSKGNGKIYYVFLKTPGLSRVWYSYRASFVASENWTEVTLPFADFQPSHDAMPQSFKAADVNSIAIVAYGADYQADVMLDWIKLY